MTGTSGCFSNDWQLVVGRSLAAASLSKVVKDDEAEFVSTVISFGACTG